MKISEPMPFISFAVGVVLTAMIYTIVIASFFEVEWETILSAVLALVAAAATVYFLHSQQKQTERLHHEEIKRRFNASIAVAPLALSEICSYAKKSLEFSVKSDACLRGNTEVDFDPPVFPEAVISILREVIENSEDDHVNKAFSILVSEIQVHIARQRDLPKTRDRKTLSGRTVIYSSRAFDHAIIDASSLYIFASMFFDFARGRSKEPLPLAPPSSRLILDGLFKLDIDRHAFPNVYALLGYEEGTNREAPH